jgi:molybdate transport system substrate-binding protein
MLPPDLAAHRACAVAAGTAVPASVDPELTVKGVGARAPRENCMRFAVAVLLLALSLPAAAQEKLTVFAAASLRNALEAADAAFSNETGLAIVASYAASSALAKQIGEGAPADVLISADTQWMDWLASRKLIAADTRVNLLGNALVLIAAKGAALDHVDIVQGFDLARLAGDGRIAVADVRAVPAGLYAKAALEKLGVWAVAQPKLAQAENVRAALSYVARGEAPLGIVYATDAKVEPGVKIVGTFPENSHPPIVYPAAIVAGHDRAAAKRYLDFLRGAEARVIFESYGFSVIAKTGM